MELQTQLFEKDIYAPEIEISCITKKQMLAKIMIVRLQEPGRICGIAKRIGFTGKEESDLAIYRLKILRENTRLLFTIPALFVVTEGKFVEYERWRQTTFVEQDGSKKL